MLWLDICQGGVTPILTVLLSATAVKVLVKRQSKETPSSQWSRTLFTQLNGQQTWRFNSSKVNTTINITVICIVPYSRKVWQGKSLVNLANHPWFAKLKRSKFLFTIITTFWLNWFILQTFFRQMLKTSKFTKLLLCQTFPLYSIRYFMEMY